MTAGITGVFWLPRMAEANSIALNAGAHAVPISAAATAWGALTGVWVDATATVARVMAELGVGMQGINGIAALSRLTGFMGWAEQQGVMAAAMATKTAANATAYTVASLAMPSLPEIVAVNAAVVASANPPGALSGAFEVAEVAKNAMDIRAALVMETYEAATSALVTTPGEFARPPAIANGAGTADGASEEAAETAFQGDPIQGAVAAATAFAQNPAVVSAATQAANVAGSVVGTGVTTAGNLGGAAISALTGAGSTAPAALAPMGLGVAGAAGAAAASTRSAALSGVGAGGSANGNGKLTLPEGWGAGAAIGAGMPVAAAVGDSVVARVDGAPVRTATGGQSPLLGNARGTGQDDEGEHDAADYLRSAEHFHDGRWATDGVIGADAGTSR
ncbi:PPE domain-containing protein [Nocardia sp. NPDC050697]|uniref:PPE domain-containing protein n=1 Tax=Nocardia sp. NPDC050697 TaxID=3155158 RepID=UPI0033FD994F